MRRVCALGLSVLLVVSQVFSEPGYAQNTLSDYTVSDKVLEMEKVRIERLAGLGKLWGSIKYFHPYLAYKDLDWDAALVATIPKVNAARSPGEYRDAINHLLSFLHDPATHAKLEASIANEQRPAATANTADKTSQTDFIREVDGVTAIRLMPVAQLMWADQTKAGQLTMQLTAALNKAKAVVLDCRGKETGGNDDDTAEDFLSYFFNSLLPDALAQIADGPVMLGSVRYRIHSGYATQTGGTSGGYYSGFVTSAPNTLGGHRSKGNRLPLAILINGATPDNTALFSGFQTAGLATIVQEGSRENDSGTARYSMKLPDGVSVRIRTFEVINPAGSIGFSPDVVVAKTDRPVDDAALAAAIKATSQPASTKTEKATALATVMCSITDNPYPEMKFPNTEYRLLALFRFWNVINYFFPYKYLLDELWEDVLTRFIPQFEANKDQIEYQKTVREMVAQIQDTHGFVSGVREFDESLGTFYAPLFLHYAEGQAVIAKLLDEAVGRTAGLNVGDIILAIDGEPVAQHIERLSRLFAVSTPQAMRWRVTRMLLAGAQGSKAKLTVRGADGQTREVEIERKIPSVEYFKAAFEQTQRKTPVYEVLPSGFGYVDLARLQFADADKALDALLKTPAIIFDMRGYPNGTAWKIAPRLTTKKNVIGAQFRRPLLEAITLGATDYSAGSSYMFEQPLPLSSGKVYKGKVVMLINEEAISQAEHTCLFFEAATNVTFIGSPTNGANGDATVMVLPDNIIVMFSGHDVRHADGRRLQRLGIQPHIKVEATIRGIRENRDEILETALKYLQGNITK
jgi:C-terminal processing protease CtpA/Prc